MLWFYENDSILNATFSTFTKTTDTFNKIKRCQTTLEGLSSVCTILEPASSKNNEILEINVLQKFTPHALYSNKLPKKSLSSFKISEFEALGS